MLEMKYNLSWDGFSEHLKKFMSDLYTSETYSDVTLVCDDQMKMKANKLVLRACSPIFESMLSDLHQAPNTIIFLRGINHLELESILQFVYLGETKIYQNRMEAFMTVAKDLQIKEIHNTEFNHDSNVDYETTEMINDENDSTVEEDPILLKMSSNFCAIIQIRLNGNWTKSRFEKISRKNLRKNNEKVNEK